MRINKIFFIQSVLPLLAASACGGPSDNGNPDTDENVDTLPDSGMLQDSDTSSESASLPWLTVNENRIEDPEGNRVILRGVSLPDIGVLEFQEGGAFAMVDRLTDLTDTQGGTTGWYPRVLRLPASPTDSGVESPLPYIQGSDEFYDTLLQPLVDYCREKGLYVIVDWHHFDDTFNHTETTKAFWEYIAPKFADDSNVLFELYNEPINLSDWESVRQDMQEWYDAVRAEAPRNLVLVGTPSWCQDLVPAVSAPVVGNNIVYVVHTYPLHIKTQYDSVVYNISTAAQSIPLFMTEWGFQEDTGELLNGTITDYGNPLKDIIEEYGLSWTAWCASTLWGPTMFDENYMLKVGEAQMGGFVKEWLYEKRGDDLPKGME